MDVFDNFYRGKKVFLTGHTGFKGAWLSQWLLLMGAEVTGFSLEPNTQPSLFEQLSLEQELKHIEGDIRDYPRLKAALLEAEPDIVLHLAAQPLVRLSYDIPIETYQTNVMGTIHLLDALRSLKKTCAAVFITTDKCYENKEWLHAYREEDPMGGYDPYSSSKGCAELAINSMRNSFFNPHSAENNIGIASARAGNVIGGGDWALDRIVPDCMRALADGKTIAVRNPHATRPWQHVLEPLGGYLYLAKKLYLSLTTQDEKQEGPNHADFASAFNFGPSLDSNRNVGELVDTILKHWPGSWNNLSEKNAPHEASLLNLTIDKAFHLLKWKPAWDFDETLRMTTEWYHHVAHSADKSAKAKAHTIEQINHYCQTAKTQNLNWNENVAP